MVGREEGRQGQDGIRLSDDYFECFGLDVHVLVGRALLCLVRHAIGLALHWLCHPLHGLLAFGTVVSVAAGLVPYLFQRGVLNWPPLTCLKSRSPTTMGSGL